MVIDEEKLAFWDDANDLFHSNLFNVIFTLNNNFKDIEGNFEDTSIPFDENII